MHCADYALIKALYPNAVLNVFGDKNQVLHDACGINDWNAETGIQKVYTLNSNYRNNAAIVDFCNKKIRKQYGIFWNSITDKVKQLTLADQIDKSLMNEETVVIVKNEQMFKEFSTIVRDEDLRNRLFYVDTRVDIVPENVIPCYTIFAAKGLEFKSVLVYAKQMTQNQKIVACTRAMEFLFYYGE